MTEDIVFEEWAIRFVEHFKHCQEVIASIVCISLGIKQIGAVAFICILLIIAGIEQNPGPMNNDNGKDTLPDVNGRLTFFPPS